MEKISLEKMAQLISDPFTPLEIFKVNETAVRLVKIQGKYHWHKHSNEDELFLVLKGQMTINLKDSKVTLNEGEGFVVKAGVMHQSFANREALILMVEPYETVATGD